MNKSLVSFGNYLLSDERKNNTSELNQKEVTHADIENWKHLEKGGEQKMCKLNSLETQAFNEAKEKDSLLRTLYSLRNSIDDMLIEKKWKPEAMAELIRLNCRALEIRIEEIKTK